MGARPAERAIDSLPDCTFSYGLVLSIAERAGSSSTTEFGSGLKIHEVEQRQEYFSRGNATSRHIQGGHQRIQTAQERSARSTGYRFHE